MDEGQAVVDVEGLGYRYGATVALDGVDLHVQVGELVRGAAVRRGVPTRAARPALVEVGLSDLARRRTHRLSGGQQQRLPLAPPSSATRRCSSSTVAASSRWAPPTGCAPGCRTDG